VSDRRLFVGTLCVLGVGWGLTQPLGKMAVETGHQPFGLIFWQLVICSLVLGAISLPRGKGLVLRREAVVFYVVVALLGTLIPNYTFYLSVERLPSGIMSILISMVPLIAFPLALAMGIDRFSLLRLLGLCLGIAGVGLIALPEGSLPEATAGLDPVQAMFGASVVGALICLPMALASGQFVDPLVPWGRAEWALVASSCIHGLVYAAYVWLAARAGAVFAAQCSYLVTATGVIWAMVLLGERFSPMVWLSLVIMLSGVALVQPRAVARN
jgi:drug/metabolite transporter (DMT)-like permease